MQKNATLQAEYNRLAELHRLHPAIVYITFHKATGGWIKNTTPYIIVVSGHMSPEEQIITLRHEAAHSYCWKYLGFKEGHSKRFWNVAEAFGVNRKYAPQTEASIAKKARRIQRVYECPDCLKEFTFTRLLTTTKVHTTCSSRRKNLGLPVQILRLKESFRSI